MGSHRRLVQTSGFNRGAGAALCVLSAAAAALGAVPAVAAPSDDTRAEVDRLYEEGATEVKTGVLLAKDKARAAAVEADYVGFIIADECVVGYGLDYQGRYRNLPYVGVLKPEAQ